MKSSVITSPQEITGLSKHFLIENSPNINSNFHHCKVCCSAVSENTHNFVQRSVLTPEHFHCPKKKP